ncbi:MAG: type VI secretion system baseplate subunit TssK [Pseudomonadota bacterium]
MSWRSKVAWTEGMFLRPQHFQQEARYVERLVDARVTAGFSHRWGFEKLQVDEALLGAGQISVSRAAGVLPDGGLFDCPTHDAAPEVISVDEKAIGKKILLTTPTLRDGDQEADEGGSSRRRVASLECRDVVTEAATEPADVDIATLRFSLAVEGADGVGSGLASLPVCRIADVRPDGGVVLDAAFAPPALRMDAAGGLKDFLRQIGGLIENRAQALADRVSAAGRGGVADVSDFLLLQTLNRYAPLFRHAAAMKTHPEDAFKLAIALCGDLAVFARPDKLPATFPDYAHGDAAAAFAPVAEEARRALSFVGDPSAVQIPLPEKKYGIRVAEVGDASLYESAQFVLAVGADMPSEDVRRAFPQQVKIGGVEVIRDLITVQLPGVRVRPLPVAPRQIPFHAGKTYFELERQGEYWEGLKRSAGFAVHVGGSLPGITVHLWAIRQAG